MGHNGAPPRKLVQDQPRYDDRRRGRPRPPQSQPREATEREVVPMSDDDWRLFKGLVRHYKVAGDVLIRYLMRREGERVGLIVQVPPSEPPSDPPPASTPPDEGTP